MQSEDLSANSSFITLQTAVDGHTTSISDIETDITNLQSYDTTNTSNIASIQSDITSLQSYNTSNDTAISTIQSNVSSLGTSKQNVIDVNNKPAIANVNLGSSALSHVDISASLQPSLNIIK